jgi:ribosomal-protein-alanine N-acetyltransferase
MRLPFGRTRAFSIIRLTVRDAGTLEGLHREDFSRPWSAAEFEGLIAQPTVFGYLAVPDGRPRSAAVGFVLARLAAGEAEILTVAVSRACRRLGLGRRLMDAVLRDLHAHRAEALFLEVDETNAPAIGLYRVLGFREVGRREGYYQHAGSARTGALVMRRDLR